MGTGVDIATAFAVEEALGLYDHLVDARAWEDLAAVIDPALTLRTPQGSFSGVEGVRAYEEAGAQDGHLPAHHVLNTQVEATAEPGVVRAWSRYLLVTWEYAPRVGDYLDLLSVEGDGAAARLLLREIIPRGPGGGPRPEHASFARWRALST